MRSPKFEGYSPPRSPPSQSDLLSRSEHSTSSSCKDTHLLPTCWLRKTFIVVDLIGTRLALREIYNLSFWNRFES
jgi:hypothetical protein